MLLLHLLTRTTKPNSKEADDEPDGGEGSPETLGLFTQIMARFSGRKRVVYHEASSADFQVETVEMA